MQDSFGRIAAWVESCLGTRALGWRELPGGAGARRYWRIALGPGGEDPRLGGGNSVVLMHAVPESAAILPPALRCGPAPPEPFVAITRLLARHGLPVPAILGVEPRERWVLLEDLGAHHLCDLAPAALAERQSEAIDLLARAHAIPLVELPFERSFDAEWARFELEHFMAYALPTGARSGIERELEPLTRAIEALPRVFSLRDYQSRNLMIDAQGRLRVIDYQDALAAPRELDLVALLYDSYVEIPDARRGELHARYAERSGVARDPAALALLIVQRKAKDLGRYCYLVQAIGDTSYAPAIRAARRAVLSALPQLPPGLAGLRARLRAALEASR